MCEQLAAKLVGVIQTPVVNQLDVAPLAREGHTLEPRLRRRRKSLVAECDRSAHPHTAAIATAVRDRLEEPIQDQRIDRRAIAIEYGRDTAHGRLGRSWFDAWCSMASRTAGNSLKSRTISSL